MNYEGHKIEAKNGKYQTKANRWLALQQKHDEAVDAEFDASDHGDDRREQKAVDMQWLISERIDSLEEEVTKAEVKHWHRELKRIQHKILNPINDEPEPEPAEEQVKDWLVLDATGCERYTDEHDAIVKTWGAIVRVNPKYDDFGKYEVRFNPEWWNITHVDGYDQTTAYVDPKTEIFAACEYAASKLEHGSISDPLCVCADCPRYGDGRVYHFHEVTDAINFMHDVKSKLVTLDPTPVFEPTDPSPDGGEVEDDEVLDTPSIADMLDKQAAERKQEEINEENVDKIVSEILDRPRKRVWDQPLAEDLTQRLHKISDRNYKRTETVAKKVYQAICDLVDEQNESTRRWEIENGLEPSKYGIEKPEIWSEKMRDGRTKWLISWEDSPIDDDYGTGWIAGLEGCTWNNCDNYMEAEYTYVASFV